MKKDMRTRFWDRLLGRLPQRLRSLDEGKRSILKGIGVFLFGFLLGRTELPGRCAPLGPAFTAAWGAGGCGAAAAAGVMLGSVAGFGLTEGLKTAAAVLLVYAALFLLRDWSWTERAFFAPLTAAIMTGLIGAVYLRWGPHGPAELVLWGAEALLAGFTASLYRLGLRREPERAALLGTVLLGLSLVMALNNITVAGVISLGRCAAAFAVLTAAWLEGAPAGGLAGLLLGLSLDAAGATPGVCALALGCAGALGGFAGGRSRLLTALGCVLGNAAAAFWGAEAALRTGLLYEFFIASVLFLLPPERFFENLRRQAPSGENRGLLRYLQGRTGLAAAAFGELHSLLAETPVSGRNDEDVLSAFDAAAEQTCRGCRKREVCWGMDFESTRGALQTAWAAMEERGSASPEDFPLWFRDRCLNIRGYAAAVSRERRELLRRRQMKQRLREDRNLLERQYADFAAVLRDLALTARGAAREEPAAAKRLRLFLRDWAPGTLASAFRDGNGRLHVELEGTGKAALLAKPDWLAALSEAAGTELVCPEGKGEPLHLCEKEPLEAEVGVAACCRGGKAPSGDVARSFKTAEGVLCLLVADGMGSGPEAAGDSEAAANLAEKLLRSGIGPETVMRLLNTALLLRSEKRIGSLSLDLLSVNLFSGETCLYKYGAAPSYVRSGGRVHLIRGESAAAGTEDRGPDCTRLQLDPGSAAVILTDGAARAEQAGDKLLRCGPAELRELAGDILAEAGALGGWEDDMTVLTLSLRKRGEPGIS